MDKEQPVTLPCGLLTAHFTNLGVTHMLFVSVDESASCAFVPSAAVAVLGLF